MRMTVLQLKKACKGNKYLLLRFQNGHNMGVNAKIAKIALKKKTYKDDAKTDFVSYLPCDFQTYITHKHPFFS